MNESGLVAAGLPPMLARRVWEAGPGPPRNLGLHEFLFRLYIAPEIKKSFFGGKYVEHVDIDNILALLAEIGGHIAATSAAGPKDLMTLLGKRQDQVEGGLLSLWQIASKRVEIALRWFREHDGEDPPTIWFLHVTEAFRARDIDPFVERERRDISWSNRVKFDRGLPRLVAEAALALSRGMVIGNEHGGLMANMVINRGSFEKSNARGSLASSFDPLAALDESMDYARFWAELCRPDLRFMLRGG